MRAKNVPREKVPWHPTVDAGKCTGCRVCFEFCQHGVYAWDDRNDIAVVQRLFNCLVGCNGCEGQCPAGAISFPDVDEIAATIRKLREELRRS
jgi:NAD-dependent dihydropyrimidine dehydrogenase PreA subunit